MANSKVLADFASPATDIDVLAQAIFVLWQIKTWGLPKKPNKMSFTTNMQKLKKRWGILDNVRIHKTAKIEYSPTANLLFIKAENGEGFSYYMSIDELDECKK